METNQHSAPQSEAAPRRASIGGLAVVGFVALILIGIATAIYAASFLPKALSGLTSANVYLSSLVQPGNGGQLEATNPSATTQNNPNSIPVTPATTTISTTYTPAPTTPAPTPTYTKPTPTYTYTQPTYVQVPATPSYYGLPDLVTTITSVGYLTRNGDTSSFVANDSVPSGRQGAVRFVIANRGTNISGQWQFEANLPGGSNPDYRSAYQQSLKPGDSIVYTLGFDSTLDGTYTVRIEADSNDQVNESNESNNTDSASVRLNDGSSYNGGGSYDSNGNYCTYGTYYSNGRYYCNSSNNNNGGSYDSNGNYCPNGTYYQNQHYYCNSSIMETAAITTTATATTARTVRTTAMVATTAIPAPTTITMISTTATVITAATGRTTRTVATTATKRYCA